MLTDRMRTTCGDERGMAISEISLIPHVTSKVVVSFYMDNIPDGVVASQRAVLKKFVPPDFEVRQILIRGSHAVGIDEYMTSTAHDLVAILDIDCVPLHDRAIPALAAYAARGELAGCVQRANHLNNHGHLYVGPFCMALTRQLWKELGCPSFAPTDRGDVGEELTYRCEVLGHPIHTLWPSQVGSAQWKLTDDRQFGLNTEYEGAFLHTFGIRDPANQEIFMERCQRILEPSPELDLCAEPFAGVQAQPNANHPDTPAATIGGAEIESDKHYWHRYTDTYEKAFVSLGEAINILEFGVLEGASIRWLANRFPRARIVGLDIAAPIPDWPRGDRIEYVQIDQGDVNAIEAMFVRFGRRFDLILDDGSHLPLHQATCLVKAFPFIRPGGLYIVEDVHTSHPENPDFRQFNPPDIANCLHVLLAMRHLKDCANPLTDKILSSLTAPGFFSKDDLLYLFGAIKTIELYKRAILPLRCYRCGSSAFDYKRLRCICGVDLYAAADSMSFLLWKAD
jgi:hypothetical protein